MKRGFIALLLLILLVSPMVFAQEETPETTDGETPDEKNIFEGNVKIPSIHLMFLYHTPSFEFSWNWIKLIIYITTAAILFASTLEILSFTTMESWWAKIAIAGALLVTMQIFGYIEMMTDLNRITFIVFNFIKLNMWWVIAIALLIPFILKPLLSGTKKQKRLARAEELGTRAGAVLKNLEEQGKATAKGVSKS